MPKAFSLSDTRNVAPADFHRWALGGTLLGAIGYTIVALVGQWQVSAGGAFQAYTPSVAAIVCWGAVLLVSRGHPRGGLATAICVIWLEVHAAFAVSSTIPSPGLLVAPILVLSVGLLLGSRASLVLTIAAILITTPLYLVSAGSRGTALSSTAIYWLAIHAVVTLAAWALVAMSLAALSRVLRAVQEKEHELADMIAFAPDGILVVGRDDRVLVANPAAGRMLGLNSADCIGRGIVDVLADAGGYGDPDATLLFAEPMQAPIAWNFARPGREPVHVEVTWRAVDERRRQLMLRDVSERLRAEKARRDIELQLAHAQRLEAVGQLAGGIAHDFNNLLMTVGGSADLLRLENDPEQRTMLLDEVMAAQERGAALTRQLLAFARREIIHPTVLDLSDRTAHLQRFLQRVTGERVPVHCDLEPDCRVCVDIGQIEQVLVNLVANARDAMPDGGSCAISVSQLHRADGARFVRLQVADQGVGMDAATVERAFEPFFTTKPRGRGTGLGLASVHGIVLQSGGQVSLQSVPGHGTTVVIDFPFANAPIAAASPVVSRSSERSSAGQSILVADDDDSTRAIVGIILERAGYRVQLVPDGLQALRRLEAVSADVDILITDVMMPGLTGPQLAERARARHPTLPIVFMSGYPEDVMGQVAGFRLDQDFIAKPFTGVKLTELVARRLGEQRPHPAGATESA